MEFLVNERLNNTYSVHHSTEIDKFALPNFIK